MLKDSGSYKVLLDQRWTLNDLHVFPHNLNEAYAFYVCFDPEFAPVDTQKIDQALHGYPWKGGWSVVHIYDLLQSAVPPQYQPEIRSLRYESPGWLELAAHLESIEHVARSVYQVLGAVPPVITLAAGAPVALKIIEKSVKSAERIANSYASIQKILRDNRQGDMEHRVAIRRLEAEEVSVLRRLSEELSQLLGFKGYKNLVRRTGNDEVAAKLLCAQYRRLRKIADYVQSGQASLPTTGVDDK